MTERRPHWDDDLIEAVSCLVSVDIGDDCLVVADVYAIIAAVEDWHEKFVMHGAFRVLAERAASAEADRDRLANQLLNEVPSPPRPLSHGCGSSWPTRTRVLPTKRARKATSFWWTPTACAAP